MFSRRTPSNQGHQEKGVQTACSPRAELKPEKKSGYRLQSHRNSSPQKELRIPGIVDFQLIQAALSTPKPQTPVAYRFGRLSHHSFFSRHRPHPQRVTHIQDLTGKPICVVRDNFSLDSLPPATLLPRCLMGMPTISVPIGDPQSNRDPRLSYAWKKELKNLASRVAVFTKESELKSKEQEEAQREQGAKYSAETGRLIPTSTQAIGHRHSRQSPWIYPSGKDGAVQTFTLQDRELLGGLILPGIRFSGPVGRGPRADPGTPLSNPADRFLESYPVLATARAPEGKRFGPGAPADSGGAAPPSAPGLHASRKTSGSAPGNARVSREATATLQPILEEDEDDTSTQERQTRVAQHLVNSSQPSLCLPSEMVTQRTYCLHISSLPPRRGKCQSAVLASLSEMLFIPSRLLQIHRPFPPIGGGGGEPRVF
ncbi:protein TBATA isoform X4 [Suricata suricatta]|uniref:protein TBATA isoform X4 n=1 Tax=Suricata suricatta TaxID=37032 RepID=UPI001155A6F3|nr:protein TBATA isoform X4 [Suricata suricatta]